MWRLSWNLGASTLQACLGIFLLIISPHLLPHTLASIYLLPTACYVFGWLSCVSVGTQDSHPLECIIPDDVLIQFDPPDDEHLLLETSRGVTYIEKSASSWSLTRITSRCTVNEIQNIKLYWLFWQTSQMSLSHRSTYCRCILYFTELSQLCCMWNSARSLQQEEITARWKHCVL